MLSFHLAVLATVLASEIPSGPAAPPFPTPQNVRASCV